MLLSFKGVEDGIATFEPSSACSATIECLAHDEPGQKSVPNEKGITDARRITDGPSFGISSPHHFVKAPKVTAVSLYGYRPTVLPSSGRQIAQDPSFVVGFTLPAPRGRLVQVDLDLGPVRAGWTVSYTAQGKGWYDEERKGVFEAEVIIHRVRIPVPDLWRAPTTVQRAPPSTAAIEQHRRKVEGGPALLGGFVASLAIHELGDLAETLAAEEEADRQAAWQE